MTVPALPSLGRAVVAECLGTYLGIDKLMGDRARHGV
jgi:hypothetical protein